MRGCIFPATTDVAYPRANPADAEHLPIDVWAAAQVPVGVRLEFVGDAELVRIEYQTATANLGYRGEGAGATFMAYRSGRKVAEVEAMLGAGVVELELYGDPDRPTVVYLPEGMRPTIQSIHAMGGSIAPAPVQPRWLCYGDATTQGWLASSPAMSWPSVVSRKLGLDLVNLGYAGATRVETTSAMSLADTPGEVISVAFSSNGWRRIPHSPGLMAEEARSFLRVIRDTRPNTPVIVLSPTLRPDAEDEPNRLGATLDDLRFALEDVVHSLQQAGDTNLYLVEGARVLGEEDLADGIYPGDEGHKRLAAAVGKYLSPLMTTLRQEALARRQEDVVRAVPALRLLKTEVEDDPAPSDAAGHRADRATAGGRARPGHGADQADHDAAPARAGRVDADDLAEWMDDDEEDAGAVTAEAEALETEALAADAATDAATAAATAEASAPEDDGSDGDPNAQAVLDSILALAITPTDDVPVPVASPPVADQATPAEAPAAATPAPAAAAVTAPAPAATAPPATPGPEPEPAQEVAAVGAGQASEVAMAGVEVPVPEVPAAATPGVEVVNPVPVEVVPEVPVEVVPVAASAAPVETAAPLAPAAAALAAPTALARQPAVAQEFMQAVAFLNEQRGQL